MKVWPQSSSDWLGLVLVPFKVFVPCGYLMVMIQRETLGYRMDIGAITPFVIGAYLASFFCLVLAAMVQKTMGKRRAYLSTCGFIVALFFFVSLMLPYLAHS
jgi:Na+/phosphate symporter